MYTLFQIRSLKLVSFKVCLCVIVLSVTVCTVGYITYVCLFRRDRIFVDFVQFLIHDNLWSFIYVATLS